MSKYKVVRERYSRSDLGDVTTTVLTANTDAEALVMCCDNYLYAYEDANGNEFGDKEFIMPTKEALLKQIEAQNGDGADFIMLIKNIDTDEILFQSKDVSDIDLEDEDEYLDDEDIEDTDDGLKDYEIRFKVKGLTDEELRWILKYGLEALSKELDIDFTKFEDINAEED